MTFCDQKFTKCDLAPRPKFINQSQPDTTAIASLLQLNNTTTSTNLIDVHASETDNIIATKISNLFASDSFEKIVKQKTLSAEFDILFNCPGDLTSTSKITLLPGDNLLWLKEFPAKGIRINESPVMIDQQPPLTLVTFQALIEDKMSRLIDQIKILKIEGSIEAYSSVNKMINFFALSSSENCQLKHRFRSEENYEETENGCR